MKTTINKKQNITVDNLITKNELSILKAIPQSMYIDLPYNDDRIIGFPTYLFDVSNISKISGKKLSGTCSQLIQKKLIVLSFDYENTDINDDTITISLTKLGFDMINKN